MRLENVLVNFNVEVFETRIAISQISDTILNRISLSKMGFEYIVEIDFAHGCALKVWVYKLSDSISLRYLTPLQNFLNDVLELLFPNSTTTYNSTTNFQRTIFTERKAKLENTDEERVS